MKVLVDTSVWIRFFRSSSSPEKEKLEALFLQEGEICVCGLILTEFLQGIRSDREFREVKKLFSQVPCLPMQRSTFEFAASIYRDLKKRGVTIRNTVDCLIVAVVLEQNAALLHADKDFDFIAKHFPLRIL